MDVTTVQQAEQIVEERVFADRPHSFVVLRDKTKERGFGWVVFYTTEEFLKSGNPGDLVPGVGPVVVLRDGAVVPLSTSVPPAMAISIYEEQWNKKPESSDNQ